MLEKGHTSTFLLPSFLFMIWFLLAYIYVLLAEKWKKHFFLYSSNLQHSDWSDGPSENSDGYFTDTIKASLPPSSETLTNTVFSSYTFLS